MGMYNSSQYPTRSFLGSSAYGAGTGGSIPVIRRRLAYRNLENNLAESRFAFLHAWSI
jgi:hypothetical protein